MKGAREAVDESPYITKEEAEELVDEATDSYSVEELRERLPQEIFEAVMDHIDLDDSPPETMEEVGKSAVLAKALYDDVPLEESNTPQLEKGVIGSGPMGHSSSVDTEYHLPGAAPWKELEEVEISKSTEHRVDLFYEDVEGR